MQTVHAVHSFVHFRVLPHILIRILRISRYLFGDMGDRQRNGCVCDGCGFPIRILSDCEDIECDVCVTCQQIFTFRK